MQKTMKLTITVLIIIGLLLLAPLGTGMLVEKHFHKLLKESLVHLEAYPNAEFKLLSYKRGWFKSEVKGMLVFRNVKVEGKAVEPVEFTFHDYIKHGPIVIAKEKSGKPRVWFGLALSKAYLDKVSGMNVQPLPLEVGETGIGFRNELDTVVNIDKLNFDFANFSVVFSGLKDHFDITHDYKKINNHLELKNIQITEKTTSQKLDLNNVQTYAEISKNAQGLWLGDKKLEVESSSLMLNGKNYVVKGLYSKTRSFEHDNQIRSDIRLNVRSAGVGEKMYGPHRLVLDVDGIDASILSKLNEAFMSLSHEKFNQAKAETPTAQTGEILKNEALLSKISDLTSDLIKKGFTIEVKSLEIATAWGVLTANSRLKLPNLSSQAKNLMNSPFSIFASLLNMDSRLNAEIPADLVKKVFEVRYQKMLEAQHPAQAAQTEKQAVSELAEKHVAKLVADGWFIPKGDKYEISLSFKNGEFLVNNKPLKPHGILPELAPVSPAPTAGAPNEAPLMQSAPQDGANIGQQPESAPMVPGNMPAQTTPMTSPTTMPTEKQAPTAAPAEDMKKNEVVSPTATDNSAGESNQ